MTLKEEVEQLRKEIKHLQKQSEDSAKQIELFREQKEDSVQQIKQLKKQLAEQNNKWNKIYTLASVASALIALMNLLIA